MKEKIYKCWDCDNYTGKGVGLICCNGCGKVLDERHIIQEENYMNQLI